MVNIYRLMVQEVDEEAQTFRNVNVRNYCLTFFSETSMAGFPMLIKQPGILKKFFWLCSIALMAAGLWWECSVFFDKFLQWQATTSVSIETSRRLYFPGITICNNNPVVYNWYNQTAFEESFRQPSSSSGGTETTAATVATSSGSSSGSASGGTAATAAASGSGPGTGAPPSVKRKKREITAKPFLQREKRNGGIMAVKAGPGGSSSSTFSGSGGSVSVSGTSNVKQFDSSPQFSDSMQELLNIQEKAANVPYPERSVAGHQLCDDFRDWHWNSQFGNCYTFNAGFLEEESPVYEQTTSTWSLKRGGDANDTGIRISKLPGDSYGLYLLLNADIDHYVPTTTQIGWRITVHNQTEMPFPDESGVFVEPGTSTRIGLSLSYIQQLGYISNFLYTAPYSDCVSDDTLYHNDARNAYTNQMEISYTSTACYKTCYQKVVIKACGCFDFLYPDRGFAFGTSVTGNNTIPPCSYKNDTQWTCRNTISAFYQADALNCSDTCKENCDGYAFGISLSSMRWPNPATTTMQTLCKKILGIINKRLNHADSTCNGTSYMRNMFQGNFKFKLQSELEQCISGVFTDSFIQSYYQVADYIIGNSFAEVYIYYKDFNFQSVIASEAMELPDLIAYMGGILGLFFGFTFMTMMEYVMLIIDLIGILLGKLTLLCCKNKIADGEMLPQRLTSGSVASGNRLVVGYPVPKSALYDTPGDFLKPQSASFRGPDDPVLSLTYPKVAGSKRS